MIYRALPNRKCAISYTLLVMLFLMATTANAQRPASESGADRTISRTVRWQYDGYTFTDQLTFSQRDYLYYRGKSKLQPYNVFASDEPGHAYLLQLAAALDADAKSLHYEGYTLAAYLVAFVQQAIPYKADPYNNGYDYPRYPIETLVDQGGDCEDKAALLVALLNTFGFDAVLVYLPGHMAAAMSCKDCGSYYNYHGKTYAYIETTAAGWQIGAMPPKEAVGANLLDVPRPAQYRRDQPPVNYASNGQHNDQHPHTAPDHSQSNTTINKVHLVINGVSYEIKATVGSSTTININGNNVSITDE